MQKLSREGRGGGAYNRMYFVLFTGRWAYNWGRVGANKHEFTVCAKSYQGREGGVLIIGCIFLFTGRWAYNLEGLYFGSGGGGGGKGRC